MKTLEEKFNYIEVVDINDHLVYFYWGRHADHYATDMRLGGGTHVIHRGDFALVVDTMNLPGQGQWVRKYMQDKYSIKYFTLINTRNIETIKKLNG